MRDVTECFGDAGALVEAPAISGLIVWSSVFCPAIFDEDIEDCLLGKITRGGGVFFLLFPAGLFFVIHDDATNGIPVVDGIHVPGPGLFSCAFKKPIFTYP